MSVSLFLSITWLNLASGLKIYCGGEKETGKHNESIVVKVSFPSRDRGNLQLMNLASVSFQD